MTKFLAKKVNVISEICQLKDILISFLCFWVPQSVKGQSLDKKVSHYHNETESPIALGFILQLAISS